MTSVPPPLAIPRGLNIHPIRLRPLLSLPLVPFVVAHWAVPDSPRRPASDVADRHARAARLAADGWLREAIDLYHELQAANPLDLRAIGALRDLYQRLGKAPELARQWLLLADYRAAEGRPDRVQRALARALEIHAGADVLEEAGHRYLALGATRQAAAAYKRAAARWERAGRESEAQGAWARHAALRPALEARLQELLGVGEGPHGIRVLDEAWRLYGCLGRKQEAARSLWEMAELQEAEGLDLKAADTFRQAAYYDPHLGFESHLRRAAIYDRVGLPEWTLREWERARSALPSTSPTMN